MHDGTLQIKIYSKVEQYFCQLLILKLGMKQTRSILKCICLAYKKPVSMSWRCKTKDQGIATLQSQDCVKI